MEAIRYVTIGFAILGLIEWIYLLWHFRQPGAFAPITWLLLIISYQIFKVIVGKDPLYYNASMIWSNIILINGIVLLLAAGYIFRDLIKSWTSRN